LYRHETLGRLVRFPIQDAGNWWTIAMDLKLAGTGVKESSAREEAAN